MVKRTRDSFIKRQKEIKRKQKAQEKQARRQGKTKPTEVEGVVEGVMEEQDQLPLETES